MGLPARDAWIFPHCALLGAGLRDKTRIIATGKILTGFHMIRALALGADLCASARGMMLALGCIQAMRCNKNTCPTGITTHDRRLQKGLDPEEKSVRVKAYAERITQGVGIIAHSCGVPHPRALKRFHCRIVQDTGLSAPLDDAAQFPGLGSFVGEEDGIGAYMVTGFLTWALPILRAGAGQGQGANLQPSFGAIAEQAGDDTMAESFFDVFFEVDLGGGQYLYNQTPLRISGDIDCVPPQVGYIHLVDCIPLFTAPVGGQHVGNLTSAEHVVNPGQDPAVCCLLDGCQILTMDDCFAQDGLFHPEWNSCVPDPCPLPPGPPCANCGPGSHWVDQCSAGMDYVADQAAKVGIDTDLDPDCVADISLVMRPCPAPDDRVAIRRSAPLDDSALFPGLRPVDGHLDVIDTELVPMCVTAGGITLRAGGGQGQGANLQPSVGALTEPAGDYPTAERFL